MQFNAGLQCPVRQISPSVSVIGVVGSLAHNSKGPMQQAYIQASKAGAKIIVLNFAATEFINSQGIAALIMLLATARQQRQQLRACGLSEHHHELFALTRLNEMISIFQSEVEAIRGEHGLRSRALGSN